MRPDIENADCMVQAIASATGRPELIETLRPIRQHQLDNSPDILDESLELNNLSALFAASGENVTVSLLVIDGLTQLDELLEQGQRVLIGLPRGQSSHKPHIAHVSEKYSRPLSIEDGKVKLPWEGYISSQESLSAEELNWVLLEHKRLYLFLVS